MEFRGYDCGCTTVGRVYTFVLKINTGGKKKTPTECFTNI